MAAIQHTNDKNDTAIPSDEEGVARTRIPLIMPKKAFLKVPGYFIS